MSTDPVIVKSEEARTRLRELLDHVERGGEVRILRYQRPVAVMTSPDPNPLDDRLLAMADILRKHESEEAADEIGSCAAYIRETLRGSDDSGIAESLEIIVGYATELLKIVRDRPSAARKADMQACGEDE